MLKKALILSTIYILLLTACGQAGPLYLPQEEQAKPQTPSSAT